MSKNIRYLIQCDSLNELSTTLHTVNYVYIFLILSV